MTDPIPLSRFEEFGPLTDVERVAVAALADGPRSYARRKIIRREGDVAPDLFLLASGWVLSSVGLANEGRLITKVHLPGDVLGSASMSSDTAVETLSAASAAVVHPIPLKRIGRLLEEHPRVAAYLLLSIQRERVWLMDQLAMMGRSSADTRVAALLLDLLERLVSTSTTASNSFELLLTQDQLGDALGLTSVHVNRMLRSLTEQGVIDRHGSTVIVRDAEQLARLASRPSRKIRTDLSWLPSSRKVV